MPSFVLAVLVLCSIGVGSATAQDRQEQVRNDIAGGLESLRQQVSEYGSNPASWGDLEQQYSTALEIMRAIDTAHSRGIGLLEDQPLEAQISSIMTPELRALIDSMPRTTTHEMARKLTVGLIMGESVGSIRTDLLEAQNEDGSWGIEPGRAGNPLDTSVAITALLGVRQIQVSQEACLAAAEYLDSAKETGTNGPESGPFWALSGEMYGESHLEYAAIGLRATRHIESRVSNNLTRVLRDLVRDYVATNTDQSVFDDNSVEENALVLWSIHGLLMWNGSSWPVDAILDIDATGIKVVTDIPGQKRAVAWKNEEGEVSAYTTALAVTALAYWLPELEVGLPDLTSLPGDLLLDPARNEISAVYRNQGDSPAIAYGDSEGNGVQEPMEFLAGKARIEQYTAFPPSELTRSTSYFQEQSALQSEESQALGVVGPGDEPIPVTLFLDPDGTVAETDESNNRITLAVHRSSMGLDLSIEPEDIRYEVDSSSEWTLYAKVRAVGRDITANDNLQLTLTSSTSGSGPFASVPASLQSPSVFGRSAEYAWTLTTAPTQDTYFKVAVSSSLECIQCDANNEAVSYADVSSVQAGVNIKITSVTNQTASYAPGDDLDVRVSGEWGPSGTLDTSVEFRADGQVLGSSALNLTSPQQWTKDITILASQIAAIPIRFGVDGTPERRLEIVAAVDPAGSIPEADESDNSGVLVIQYDYPDLAISEESISVSRLDLASNPETVVSVGVRNEGTEPYSFAAHPVELVFEYSTDGTIFDEFSRQEVETGQLGYGQGLHFSAPLAPPVGDVDIRVGLEIATAPQEVSTLNNTATRVFTFTRETLTIELRPDANPMADHYWAGQPAVRSSRGVKIDVFHQAPPEDPIDPFDGVSVTYTAQFGRIDAPSDGLYTLAPSGTLGNTFQIPLLTFETWQPGEYVIYASGYEDGRLASTSTKSFHIEPYKEQRIAAVTLPQFGSLEAGQTASDLSHSGTNDPKAALLITINSTANISRSLRYEAVLEKHNVLHDSYAPILNYPHEGANVIHGEIAGISPGSINIREDVVIPTTAGTVYGEAPLESGLYQFKVRLFDESDVEVGMARAPFMVDQPSEYILHEKVFKVDGIAVTELLPIEGQEVEVILTVERSGN